MSKRSKTSLPKVGTQDLPPELVTIVQLWPELGSKIKGLSTDKLFPESVFLPNGLSRVYRALSEKGWARESQFKLIDFLLSSTEGFPELRAESVIQWIRYHEKEDYEAVIDCIQLIPPPEVTILGRLPKTGSQKIVFRANWKLQQKVVILKKLLNPSKLIREMRSHPLSADHPNIIKTYTSQNSENEIFLIEELLDEVLHDDWDPMGTERTALLIHDIGSALKYIMEQNLVHGDVKPDNIGVHRGRFILLDFGICRPVNEITSETTATGSLRTRAPELLTGVKNQSIKSDVWALGAVVSKVFCGEFPLIEKGERIPRASDPEKREKFESLLAERVRSEYDDRITRILYKCPDVRISEIIRKIFDKESDRRPTPSEIVEMVKSKFAYAIPESEIDAPFTSSPYKEIELLSAEWPDRESIERLPPLRISKLKQYVDKLKEKLYGAPQGYIDLAADLERRMRPIETK